MNFEALDFVGEWTEVKLEIIKEYAKSYSEILKSQPLLTYYYIDAFAGGGMHLTKKDHTPVVGSPINAMKIMPPFHKYYFVDLDAEKIELLRALANEELTRPEMKESKVIIMERNCNEYLVDEVFPTLEFKNYRRALCVLDPYGLDLDWRVLKMAGELETIDIFLNFPIMDINRNILHRDFNAVDPIQKDRMNKFWGDDSWINVAYATDGNLFGYPEKQSNDALADAFRKRLMQIAGFKHVAKPIAMRNRTHSALYYLFFASRKKRCREDCHVYI